MASQRAFAKLAKELKAKNPELLALLKVYEIPVGEKPLASGLKLIREKIKTNPELADKIAPIIIKKQQGSDRGKVWVNLQRIPVVGGLIKEKHDKSSFVGSSAEGETQPQIIDESVLLAEEFKKDSTTITDAELETTASEENKSDFIKKAVIVLLVAAALYLAYKYFKG